MHARDVTTSMGVEGVEDIRDFKWESQLRYYWEFNDAPPSGVHPQETIMVRRGQDRLFPCRQHNAAYSAMQMVLWWADLLGSQRTSHASH